MSAYVGSSKYLKDLKVRPDERLELVGHLDSLETWSRATRGYPGEHNKTLLRGLVRLRGTRSPLSGLHVLIAIQTLLEPFYCVRLDNLVW